MSGLPWHPRILPSDLSATIQNNALPTTCVALIPSFLRMMTEKHIYIMSVLIMATRYIPNQYLLISVRRYPATLSKAVEATLTWENTDNSSWPVTEGPTVVNHGGKYYLFYSANDFRNRDYAVGYAVADSPQGPWIKNPEPIISRHNTGLPGTGHGDIFIDRNGKFRYVFHSHNSQTEVAPRKTYIVELTFDSKGVHIDPLTVTEITVSSHNTAK